MDMIIYMIISLGASAPDIDIRTRALPRKAVFPFAASFSFTPILLLVGADPGIIARSLAPTSSIGCAVAFAQPCLGATMAYIGCKPIS
jgi:hypothetical protein